MKNLDSATPRSPRVDSVVKNQPVLDKPEQAAAPAPVPHASLPPQKTTRTKKLFRAILITLFVGICLFGSLVFFKASSLSDKIFVGKKITFFEKIKILLRGGDSQTLIGESLGQVNILLLGIGGEGHEGPYLTDTIILAQVKPTQGEVVLTSLPRDLLVEIPGNLGQRKINSAFAEAMARYGSFGTAGDWAIETAEKVTGLSIPYFAVVDFQGFEKAIDQIGGLEITVERTFTDAEFPDQKYGFLPPLTFKQGSQVMNGKTSLQYARSRHGNNNEGSDFARSIRQQNVISSFKEKVLKLNVVTDAGSINSLLNTFADHFHTNLGPAEIFRLLKLSRDNDIKTFYSLSLDETTGLLCSKILEENGAWVLLPCPGKNTEDVKTFFKNSFALGKIKSEKSVIWLGNSTTEPKTFNTSDKILKDAGLTVWEVGYSGDPLSEHIVYAVNNKPATVEFIKNNLKAFEVSLPPPGIKIDPAKVDVVIILGKEQ